MEMTAQASRKDMVIEAMRDLMKVQGNDGNWNHDPYMHGMYNGMELMFAMAEGRDTQFRDAPAKWLKDKPFEGEPEVASE